MKIFKTIVLALMIAITLQTGLDLWFTMPANKIIIAHFITRFGWINER